MTRLFKTTSFAHHQYFAAMFDPISCHGGIINQIIGDGLMALFGTIHTKGNPREQAVLSALT